MHGPTCTFWASLTAFSLKVKAIWAKHNPEKLKTVQMMKAKYDTKMKEEALLLALQEKYEAEVDDKDL